eukprot:Rmarinus@m.13358
MGKEIVAAGVTGLSSLFYVIGISTTAWWVGDFDTGFGKVDVEYGLWEGCVDGDCSDYEDTPDNLEEAQNTALTTVIFVALAVVLLGLMKVSAISLPSPVALPGLALVLLVIAFCTAAACMAKASDILEDDFNDQLDFGYSFYLFVVGFVFHLVGTALTGLTAKEAKEA